MTLSSTALNLERDKEVLPEMVDYAFMYI